MIDIHYHLLPGVDDGSPDMATSIEMLQISADDGVTHVVATPHADTRYTYRRDAHEAQLQRVREAMPSELASRLTLGLGSDFHITYENIEHALKDPAYYSINGKGYLMVELPDIGISRHINDLLYNLRVAGMTPVLTHPERNQTIQRDLTILKPWLESGLLIQVTAGALTGTFGPKAQALALQMITNRWANFVSSDAHGTGRRNPRLSGARLIVSEKFGAETAQRLFVDNPLAAFEGRPLAPQPEPLQLYEQFHEKKSWLKRILGR